MTSVKKEDETEAIRVIKFEGKDEKWREWSAKTRAIGKLKGWWEAIEGAPVDPNDKKAVEARTKANEKAHHYLLLSCCNEAFPYIEGCGGSAKDAWKALLDRYHSSEPTDLIELEGEFANIDPGDPYETPDLWILELEYIQKRIENLSNSKMGDGRIIAQIILKAPKEYEVPIKVIQTNLKSGTTSLSDVKAALRQHWRVHLKGKKEYKSNNVALNSQHGKPWRKFKGFCKKCGKQGHKATDCNSKPKHEAKNNSGQKDKSKVKCYRCGKMGHYAKDCPKKDVETGLFVGMAIEEEHSHGYLGQLVEYEDTKKKRELFLKEEHKKKQRKILFDLGLADSDDEWEILNPNSKPLFNKYQGVTRPTNIQNDWVVMMADTTQDEEEPNPKPRKKLKSDDEKTKEEKDDETAKGVAQVNTNLTLKYDIHISDDDDESTDDPAPPPVWIRGIDWGNQWCVRVSPNHPGHPNNVNQTARKDYSVDQRPLVGYIGGTLFVIEGPAPPDVTVKTWQKAQQELNMPVFCQRERGRGRYPPTIGDQDWLFECDTCDWTTRDNHWRNGFFCPCCNDYRNRTWLASQPNIAHYDLYPRSDDETTSEENYVYSGSSDSSDTCIVYGTPRYYTAQQYKTSYMAYNSKPPTSNTQYESWLLDSGATVHITNDKSKMYNLSTTKNHVTIGDGSKVVGRLQGSLLLCTPENQKLIIHNVLYLPGFNRNILSLTRLLEKGNEITADNNTMILHNGPSKLPFQKEPNSGMFSLMTHRLTSNSWTSVNCAKEIQENKEQPKMVDINEAHDKLGHCCENIIRRTCKHLHIEVKGNLLPCDACMRTKAKAKSVKKVTQTKATKIGERLYLDTSGPFPPSLKGSKYWGKICDQYTGKTWDSFLKQKSMIPTMVEDLIINLKAKGHTVSYLRCDNAGEHQEKLQKICSQLGVQLEYVAPNTPQHNGVVERRFVTDRDRAMAMMTAANFTPQTQDKLRCEAISTASKLGDILVRERQKKSAYKMFHGKPSPLIPHLVEFGRIGYVTKREAIKRKWSDKAIKCIMVGYADDHTPDTYRLYNPVTDEVILSRDVRWASWNRTDPAQALKEFSDTQPGIEQTIYTPADHDQTHTIPDDATSEYDSDSDPDSDRPPSPTPIPTRPKPPVPPPSPPSPSGEEAPCTSGSEGSVEKPTRREQRQRLTSAFRNRPYPTRSFMRQQKQQEQQQLQQEKEKTNPTIPIVEDVQEEDKTNNQEMDQSNSCLSTFSSPITSDPCEPKNWKQALSRGWHDPMASEVMNFINRKAWKKVERSLVEKLGRKPINTKFIFKVKDLADGTMKRKARIVVQGFNQIPGVDYTESFSPVATDTAIRMLLGIFLAHEKHKGWELEMFDIEAAFLNADIETRMFVNWPAGLEELGFITPEEREKYCIELGKSMYGDIAAPIRWMRTFSKVLIKKLGFTQSKVDPCVFYKTDEKGGLKVLCALFVDDTLITGPPSELQNFYEEMGKHFNVERLGKLKRHLGVTYHWKTVNGKTKLCATMPKMEKEIISTYEEYANKTVKEQPTPGYPNKTLTSHSGDPIDVDVYKSLVGKLIYYMTKVAPEMGNACRELSSHFDCPGPEHWKSVERAVGYVKGRQGKPLIFSAPEKLEPISYCDSNYATNPEDRKSISGMINTLGGMILNWFSKKQKSVTLSSTEAEYVALSECSQETKFEWMLLNELLGSTQPATIYEDNTGAIFLVKNHQVGARTKHIDVRHHYLRAQLEEKTLEVKFVNSENNVSDIMTKNCAEKVFTRHANNILNGTIESWREDDDGSQPDEERTDGSDEQQTGGSALSTQVSRLNPNGRDSKT